MGAVLQIRVNSKLYIKDPEETELGRKIVSDGIKLIDEIGFESFTFKKLAEKIQSTEASIYRYFKSKHQLLQYLVDWYWNWLEYLIEYRITNITDPEQQFEISIEVLTESDRDDPATSHINETLLHRIIVAESARVYLTKQGKGARSVANFDGYESLCKLLIGIIKKIDGRYKYSKELATTLIASVHQQIFLSEMVGTAKTKKKKGDRREIVKFIKHLVFTTLNQD